MSMTHACSNGSLNKNFQLMKGRVNIMTNQKIMSLLLAAMLLICSAGSAFAEEKIDTYDELLKYTEELFGFTDTRYYPYLPTFVDPVNYCSYLSMHSGVKGDEYYAAYNGWSEEDVALYRGYLEYWGYVGAPMACDLPGVTAWRMTSAESAREGRPLMQTVDVYHVAEHELLVIAYSYLDAWIIDEWLAYPDWHIYDHFEPGMLPCILPLSEDVTITVEEILLTDLLFVTSEGELSLYPYAPSILQERDLQVTSLKTLDSSTVQHILHVEKNNYSSDVNMMCVRISYNYGARDELLHSLRAALAEADEKYTQYADCTDVPMLLLTQTEEDSLSFSLAGEEENEDLWLVFPSAVYNAWDVQRLYFCLQDENAPWIGDLRDWRYVNFEIMPSDFR